MEPPKEEENPFVDINPIADAANPVERLEDEIICVICMEYFKQPVMICCGHNFCESCIFCFWETSGPEPFCPRCECSIQDRTCQLNIPLANVTEIAKELNLLVSRKRDEGSWILCVSHLEPMKLFCKEDEALICVVCRESQSHRAHSVLPIEEAAQECKDQIKTHLERIEKTRENIIGLLARGKEEGENMLNRTKKEKQAIQTHFTDLHQFLDKEETFLVTRLEMLTKEIIKKKADYAAELTDALALYDGFIYEMEEKCKQPADEFLNDLKSILERCKEKAKDKFENPEVFWPDLKQEIFRVTCQIPIMKNTIDHFKDTLSSAQNLHKAENMTLDPDTANHVLYLSKDRKCVEWATKWKMRPANSLRFESEPCVLGSTGFNSGRWYWVVEIEKDEGGWAIGVAKESINRKTVVRLNSEMGIWALVFSGSFSTPLQMLLKENKKPNKIQVWLDFEKQQVGFVDVDTNVPIYTDSRSPFPGEKMYPWFKVGNGSVLKLWP